MVCAYVSGANVSCDIKAARNTAVQSDPHPRSHRHTRMRLQEGDILHHCNSFKGNLQHSRAFWSLLISRTHPSHPSALPLTSLTNSLILCCKLFLHSILPEIKKTCSQTARAAREKISSFRRRVRKGAIKRGLGSQPVRALHRPFGF